MNSDCPAGIKGETGGRKKVLLTDTGGMYVKKISFDD
jgi:hypothetical protein